MENIYLDITNDCLNNKLKSNFIMIFAKIVSGLIIIFICIEVTIYIKYEDSLVDHKRPPIYQFDSITNYKYKPNMVFKKNNGIFKTNKFGFIGKDFEINDKNKLRIAFVGSSMIAGTVTLNDYYTFTDMLEEKFHSQGQMNVEIMNCAIDGSERSLENFESIERDVMKLNPNIVILEKSLPLYSNHAVRISYKGYVLCFPRDKMNKVYEGKELVDNIKKYELLFFLGYKSYIVRLLVKLYLSSNNNSKLADYLLLYKSRYLAYGYGGITPTQLTMEESANKIRTLKEKLEKRGVLFFILNFYPDHESVEMAKKFCLPLLSLNINFRDSDFIPKHAHFNDNGYKLVADSLYSKIIKYDLLNRHSL